ncbi:MAG TPA: hypothetical protein VFR44_05165 [Actinomycetota bacterium]|nr:hypothetical protein [Actinomycetota bacterium]
MKLMRGILPAVLLTALVSCASDSAPVTAGGATLLRHDVAPEDIDVNGTDIGELVLFNGCVASGGDPETTSPEEFAYSAIYLVWPAGYDLRENGSALEVLDPDGDVVVGIGDRVGVKGRWHDLAEAQEHAEIPEPCRESDARLGGLTDVYILVRGVLPEYTERTPSRSAEDAPAP